MNDPTLTPRYAILVTEHGDARDAYELSIPELLLTVRASSLQDGYARLQHRLAQVVELARRLGTLDELPPPVDQLTRV